MTHMKQEQRQYSSSLSFINAIKNITPCSVQKLFVLDLAGVVTTIGAAILLAFWITIAVYFAVVIFPALSGIGKTRN